MTLLDQLTILSECEVGTNVKISVSQRAPGCHSLIAGLRYQSVLAAITMIENLPNLRYQHSVETAL